MTLRLFTGVAKVEGKRSSPKGEGEAGGASSSGHTRRRSYQGGSHASLTIPSSSPTASSPNDATSSEHRRAGSMQKPSTVPTGGGEGEATASAGSVPQIYNGGVDKPSTAPPAMGGDPNRKSLPLGLMQQINSASKPTPVDEPRAPGPLPPVVLKGNAPAPDSSDDGGLPPRRPPIGDLLSDIRKGKELANIESTPAPIAEQPKRPVVQQKPLPTLSEQLAVATRRRSMQKPAVEDPVVNAPPPRKQSNANIPEVKPRRPSQENVEKKSAVEVETTQSRRPSLGPIESSHQKRPSISNAAIVPPPRRPSVTESVTAADAQRRPSIGGIAPPARRPSVNANLEPLDAPKRPSPNVYQLGGGPPGQRMSMNLLADINKGAKLKKVESEEEAAPSISVEGKAVKSASEAPSGKRSPPPAPPSMLLKDALEAKMKMKGRSPTSSSPPTTTVEKKAPPPPPPTLPPTHAKRPSINAAPPKAKADNTPPLERPRLSMNLMADIQRNKIN